jgi:hypothetical protein
MTSTIADCGRLTPLLDGVIRPGNATGRSRHATDRVQLAWLSPAPPPPQHRSWQPPLQRGATYLSCTAGRTAEGEQSRLPQAGTAWTGRPGAAERLLDPSGGQTTRTIRNRPAGRTALTSHGREQRSSNPDLQAQTDRCAACRGTGYLRLPQAQPNAPDKGRAACAHRPKSAALENDPGRTGGHRCPRNTAGRRCAAHRGAAGT